MRFDASYVSIWRAGIESRMARPFRVPGVASSWEPSSSGKVSQDLSSLFRPPTCLYLAPSPSSPPLTPPQATRRFPCSLFLRHCFAFYRRLARDKVLRDGETASMFPDSDEDPMITLMETRVAPTVNFTMYRVLAT